MKATLSAEEAAARLGVSRATLYAYVSRGLLRSLPGGGATRARRYPKADIEALKRKRTQRREPASVALTALSWGLPVLDSQIATIAAETLRYRGFDAIDLAASHSFEEVAALLIAGDLSERLDFFPNGVVRAASRPVEGGLARAIAALERARSTDLEADLADGEARLRTAARVIGTFADAIAGGRHREPIALRLARHFARREDLAPLVDRALVLCADHELNVSSFVARCVASARATPYDAAVAAICAFRGPRHGAAPLAIHATIVAAGEERRPARILPILRAHRALLSGFAHPLYPSGDPRAAAILAALPAFVDGDALARIHRMLAVIEEAEGLHPSVDFALAALAYCAPLPATAAMEIFAMGRTAGWMAHVLEQYAQPGLIRPRAKNASDRP